jgi:hypothetical protein
MGRWGKGEASGAPRSSSYDRLPKGLFLGGVIHVMLASQRRVTFRPDLPGDR